jgi:bifunctional non-homologous end joining protein LigD
MRPMLATLADAPLQDPRFVYEPKYDGIRALVEVDVAAADDAGADGGADGGAVGSVGAPTRGSRVCIWSRNGNDKTSQFPEIVAALCAWAAAHRRSVILDGEIVALDDRGAAMGFQRLQDRIHLTVGEDLGRLSAKRPVALIVFDLLRDGAEDLRPLPLVARRMRLEELLAGDLPRGIRLSRVAVGDGRALYEQARAEGWEGLIAKDGASVYRSGQRSLDWRKLKLYRRQEFVIGGWTEPRLSRARFGALLLGQYQQDGRLRYVGHAGSGFTEKDLQRIGGQLAEREIAVCPFIEPPPANERPHWVRPELVVEVQFSDWTDDGIARHAVFLGQRDDVAASSVKREQSAVSAAAGAAPATPSPSAAGGGRATRSQTAKLLAALEAIEASQHGSGTLELPGGGRLSVTHLGKTLWPGPRATKGDLMRYYVEVSPYILPVLRDRPLIMRRFPDGIERPAFYQQRAPADVPAGVRVERVAADKEVPSRLIGGSLATLLYTSQLAAISQDPWFSRVPSIDDLDFAAIDLDPSEGTPFSRVLDVARWTHDELDALGIAGFAKTSGATGLHIYIPMPPQTPYQSGLLLCQIVATLVARKHPREATVERSVQRRAAGTVYVDYLQNIQGKSIACAYSARASAFAGASAPLTWKEIDGGPRPEDFTIRSLPARVRAAGDLWAKLARSDGVDLDRALERAQRKEGNGDGKRRKSKKRRKRATTK